MLEPLEPRHLLSVGPSVISISRLAPQITANSSVSFSVEFSQGVTGVDAGDFKPTSSGTVVAAAPLTVTPVSASTYTVTVGGISGNGALGLKLVDDGSIRGATGQRLQQPGSSLSFSVGQSVTGSVPVLSDVNSDGFPDLIIGNTPQGGIGVCLGNGNGTFKAPLNLFTNPATSVVASKFDADVKPDLVSADAAGQLHLYHGNGDGTFLDDGFLYGAPPAARLLPGDFNRDGRPDLLVVGQPVTGGILGILQGNGDGTFQYQQLPASSSANGQDVFVLDWNADGIPDVVLAYGSNTTVLLGNGDGTFQDPLQYPQGYQQSFPTAADFNGDGNPDLASVDSTPLVHVRLSGQVTTTVDMGFGVSALTALDVNGDGSADLIAAVPGGVAVALGNGDGTFQPARPTTPLAGLPLAAADLDGDGRADLVAASAQNFTVQIDPGTTQANFSGPQYTVRQSRPSVLSIDRSSPAGPDAYPPTVQYTVTFSQPVAGVDPSDFVVNTDPTLSVDPAVTVTPVTGAVYTVQVNNIRGRGGLDLALRDDGTIHNAQGLRLATSTFVFQPTASATAVTGDFNGDGILDEASMDSSRVGIALGNGDGTFAPAVGSTFSQNSGSAFGVTAADVNTDGLDDLLFQSSNGQILNELLGNGDGTFVPLRTIATVSFVYGVGVTDLNADGRPDLVVSDSGSVRTFPGFGGGLFSPAQSFASQTPGVITADVDGDGFADLLIPVPSQNSVAVFRGTGDGTFGPAQTFSAGAGPTFITVADFNNDGHLDLAAASSNSASVFVLNGNGDGTFSSPSQISTDAPVSGLTAFDVNGDGNADLLVNLSNADHVTLLTGNGDGSFGLEPLTFPGISRPHVYAPADFKRDGLPDFMVADLANGTGHLELGVQNGGLSGQPYTIHPISLAIDRASPSATTSASSVGYTVNFSAPVSGLTPANFNVLVAGSVAASPDVTVTPVTPSSYTITINGIHGTGTIGLRFVDDGTLLYGSPISQGSPLYTVLQSFPRVTSIVPQGPVNDDAVFTVNFSKPVTGVDPSDFVTSAKGSVSAGSITVTPINAASYTVTVHGVSGTGLLGLNLTDDGSVRDSSGNPLMPSQPANLFSVPQTFYSPFAPQDTLEADFNGDGKTDIFNLGGFNYTGVLLGNGDGTYATGWTSYVTAHAPAVLADLNSDGHSDVITSAPLEVLLGNADGSFNPQPALNNSASAPVVADINGDGAPDLVVTDPAGAKVDIYLGNGNGTFKPALTLPTGAQTGLVGVADIDSDGIPDLAVSTSGGTQLSTFLGNGNGTFRPGPSVTAATHLDQPQFADFNGDGHPDLLVSTFTPSGSGRLVGPEGVLLGNGDGTFQPLHTWNMVSFPGAVISDVNADGNLDVVNCTLGTLSVMLGNGDGTFLTQSAPAPDLAQHVKVVDLNGDGRPDLLGTYFYTNALALLPTGDGRFTGPEVDVGAIPATSTGVGTAGVDPITLVKDLDGSHVDWFMGSAAGQILIADPNGLTLNGAGSDDPITLDYTNGNPLPGNLHLNGTFTINGLAGADPLAGTTLDINRSTVFLNYAGVSARASTQTLVRQWLAAGYAAGAWNGTSPGGVIMSAAAQNNPNHNTGIGWADSFAGVINTTPNTIELKYTLYGDTDFNGAVDIFDLNNLLPNYNKTAGWTGGDFTYSGTVDIFDLNALLPNYNTTPGSQVTPTSTPPGATSSVSPATTAPAQSPAPAGPTASSINPPDGAGKQPRRKRFFADRRYR